VALGCPKQEKWIRRHREDPRLPVSIGVGGSLDFIAGVQVRAPKAIQSVGLEWLWRLALQPRRLFGRYAGDFLFLVTMLLRLFWIRRSPLGRVRPERRPERRSVESLGGAWIELPLLRTPAEADEFLGRQSAAAAAGFVVDVSGRSWLNSLELGALLGLSRRGRVFLAGAPARLVRLIRLHRLDRFLRLPESSEALGAELGGAGPSGKQPS